MYIGVARMISALYSPRGNQTALRLGRLVGSLSLLPPLAPPKFGKPTSIHEPSDPNPAHEGFEPSRLLDLGMGRMRFVHIHGAWCDWWYQSYSSKFNTMSPSSDPNHRSPSHLYPLIIPPTIDHPIHRESTSGGTPFLNKPRCHSRNYAGTPPLVLAMAYNQNGTLPQENRAHKDAYPLVI